MANLFTRLYIANAVASSGGRAWKKLSAACPYLTFSSPSSFTLNISDYTKYWDGTLEYSTDLITWSTWDGTTTLSADNGKLYMRGTGNTRITGPSRDEPEKRRDGIWELTGSDISCIGNIENLLDYATVASGKHPTMADSCFESMFNKCTSLTTPPELPATTLTPDCYLCMFYRCTSLTTAPKLPATTLESGCYMRMFDDCTSLTTPPELPATTLTPDCYYGMFWDCTNIKLSTTQSEEYPTPYRVPTSGEGTTADDALSVMFDRTGGTFTGTPEINTTYYLHSSNSVV